MSNINFKEKLELVCAKLGYGSVSASSRASAESLSVTYLQDTVVSQLFDFVCDQCSMLQKGRDLGYCFDSVFTDRLTVDEKAEHFKKLKLRDESIHLKVESAAHELTEALRDLFKVAADSNGAISFADLDKRNAELFAHYSADKLQMLFRKAGFPTEQIKWLCQNSAPIEHKVLHVLFPQGLEDIEFFLDHVFIKVADFDFLKIGFPTLSQHALNAHPEYAQRIAHLTADLGVVPNIFMLISYSHLIMQDFYSQIAGNNKEVS